jgi:hypothetical protein
MKGLINMILAGMFTSTYLSFARVLSLYSTKNFEVVLVWMVCVVTDGDMKVRELGRQLFMLLLIVLIL